MYGAKMQFVTVYAEMNEMSYDDAKQELLESLEDYDCPMEFLEDLGLEMDYLVDVVSLMQLGFLYE